MFVSLQRERGGSLLLILSILSFDELNIIYSNIVNNLDTVIKGDTRTLKKKIGCRIIREARNSYGTVKDNNGSNAKKYHLATQVLTNFLDL